MDKNLCLELTEDLKSLFIETAQNLKGSQRRQFMAKVVKQIGAGGQSLAERELGWNRKVIRKGTKELESGFAIVDAFKLRGRKPIEEKLPNLLKDIEEIVEPNAQTDPSFRSVQMYSRISAAEVRRQLKKQKGYGEEELPSREVIRQKLNQLGYSLKRVVKAKPQKKFLKQRRYSNNLQ